MHLLQVRFLGPFFLPGIYLNGLHPSTRARWYDSEDLDVMWLGYKSSASVSITRCAAAAGGVSALQLLFEAIGPGRTFTIIAILCFTTVPILWFERQKGWQWRLERGTTM